MNRFALITATGFLALALTACGGHDNKQPAPEANDAAATQPAQPAQPEQAQPAQPAAEQSH